MQTIHILELEADRTDGILSFHMATPLHIHLRYFPPEMMAAINTVAREKGVNAEQYVKMLIEADLERQGIYKRPTFAELCKPFQEAFGHLTEKELDELVEKARNRYRERKHAKPKRKAGARSTRK